MKFYIISKNVVEIKAIEINITNHEYVLIFMIP